ncbi:Uncharacterised protein [Salmonella enterica subsp. enterica serovar Typhi]|nr:Uncharacterised protein [Salmonella enterica subsp. enterica serovar Typhi]
MRNRNPFQTHNVLYPFRRPVGHFQRQGGMANRAQYAINQTAGHQLDDRSGNGVVPVVININVHGFGQTSHQHTDVEQKDNGNDHRADGRRIADAGCGPGADVKHMQRQAKTLNHHFNRRTETVDRHDDHQPHADKTDADRHPRFHRLQPGNTKD